MKFECIYADPPWSYKVYSQKGQGRSAENHYHTMNKEDIYNLDVAGIAAKDCILFLWVTFPCLLEGLQTIKNWGFQYRRSVFAGLSAIEKVVHGFGDWAFGRGQIPNCASSQQKVRQNGFQRPFTALWILR